MNKIDLIEENYKPLTSYNEMAAATSEETGIELKTKKYSLVILPLNKRHAYRIKLCLTTDNTVDKEKLVTIYRDKGKYHVAGSLSLKSEIKKHIAAIKLAASYYDLNYEQMNNYLDDITNGVYAPLQIKIKEFTKVDGTQPVKIDVIID